MLISLSKEEDKETLTILLDIVLFLTETYQRNENPKCIPYIKDWDGFYDRLKERIQTFDYSELDAQRQRVDKIIYANTKST